MKDGLSIRELVDTYNQLQSPHYNTASHREMQEHSQAIHLSHTTGKQISKYILDTYQDPLAFFIENKPISYQLILAEMISQKPYLVYQAQGSSPHKNLRIYKTKEVMQIRNDKGMLDLPTSLSSPTPSVQQALNHTKDTLEEILGILQ